MTIRTRKTWLLAAAIAALTAQTATAGSYAEGDPRPLPSVSVTSSDAIASQTRTWLASATTVGYPEGNPRSTVLVVEKSRATVRADAVNWVRSGMAAMSYGELGGDQSQPGYSRAMNAYVQLSANAATAATAATAVKAETGGSAVR